MILKPRDRKPHALGSKVRVDAVHLSPAGDEGGLAAMVNGAGCRDIDDDGLKEHNLDPLAMWLGNAVTNQVIEFELPEAVSLSAISIWNYNAEWQTTNGVCKMDISVSADGTTWQPALRAAAIAEAEGTADYDMPTVLKLNNVTARKVRFENIVPIGTGGKVGLSEVIFHEATTNRAAATQPEDGAVEVSVSKPPMQWLSGQGAVEHRIFVGTNAAGLTLLRNTRQNSFKLDDVQANTAYYWRVDEVQADSSVVTGRVWRFETLKNLPVAWWKLDEAEGVVVKDATAHHLDAKLQGAPHWALGQGRIGGALEFNGTNTFIHCGDYGELNFSDGVTVAAWVKVRKFDKAWQAIVTKGDVAWRLHRYNDRGTVAFSVGGLKAAPGVRMDYGSAHVISKRSLDDGQWHHLVGAYDGRQMVIYVDGVAEDSLAVNGPLTQDAEPVLIGENSLRDGRFFNGWMDDVRLYSHGLSEEAVQILYREGQPAK